MTGTMKFNKIKVRERTDWEEELQKSWAEIKISNDFLFGKLMRKNPGLCKKLLQRILPDLEIKRIQMVETQLADTKELPRRSRYYQGMIDMNLLDKSVAYRYLNDTYIIFICPFDLYGMGLHKYTFEGRCKEAPDLKIGDGAIVAAYSVVTKDVAPYTVVGGNPARFLKNRFDSQLTQLLLEAQWWDWEPQALAQAVPMLCSPDLEAVKSWLRGLGYGAACT